MEYRPIEVKLICARDLKDVNVFKTMDVYVVGSVSGDPRSMQRTAVDKGGGTNPRWNHQMKFAVDESAARLNRLGLVFQIMSDRTLGDKEIGRVYVPLKELFDSAVAGKDENSDDVAGEERQLTYQVQTPSGKFKGQLEFSYKFGKRFTQTVDRKLDEPVMAYPPGPGSFAGRGASASYEYGYGYGYPLPPQQGGPPPNPQMGYGYGYPGQNPGGYGYPGQGYIQQPVQRPPKRGSRLGMGTAAMGVGAGLLGGLLVGEMVEDVAEAAAYDDMMDGGMFDY